MPATSPRSITLGAVRRHIRWPGLTLTETVHGSRLELPEHSHGQAALSLALSGGFEERVGDHRFRCRPFSLLYKPPGTPHSNRYGPAGARTVLVALDQEVFDRLSSLLSAPADRPVQVGGALAARALTLVAKGRASAGVEIDWEELFARVISRRVKIPEPDSTRPAWLERVDARIRERFADRLSLSRLSVLAGVHPVHLARVHRRHHGCSIGEVVRRRRIEHALDRLRSGPVDLAQLALECGFADQSHFTRVFREEVGVSPDRFRRRTLVLLGSAHPRTGTP